MIEPSDGDASLLIVEDDVDDGELILRAFEGSRFRKRLVLIRDGETALKYLFPPKQEASPVPPVMVLLDLGLPKVGGLEVLRRMREDAQLKYVPVVVFTSASDGRERWRALDGGANLFIAKPEDAESFVKFVRWIEGLLGFLD